MRPVPGSGSADNITVEVPEVQTAPAQAPSQPFVSSPSRSKKPLAQVPKRQAPPVHCGSAWGRAEQTAPHKPQLSGSLEVSMGPLAGWQSPRNPKESHDWVQLEPAA